MFQKFVRKQSGAYVIPNYELWSSFPRNVKVRLVSSNLNEILYSVESCAYSFREHRRNPWDFYTLHFMHQIIITERNHVGYRAGTIGEN